MVAASLLTVLLLPLALAAEPTVVNSFVKLSLAKRISNAGPHNLVKQDQLRIKNFMAIAEGRQVFAPGAGISSPAENQAIFYTASVGVGSPATQYDLIVDTGSSNTWIGAGLPYVKTSTSHQTKNNVSVSYGMIGGFNGTEFIDQVTIAANLVISKQSIGVAVNSSGLSGVDGVLGIGPVNLTNGTLSPDTSRTIPTVTTMLFTQGTIPENALGISFEPITNSSGQQTNGELSWGGPDSSKYTGDITYVPITKTSPASTLWGIDASFSYGETSILSSTAGIVDTGTTLVMIASDAFAIYQNATGSVPDSATTLLKITSSQYASLKSLIFTVSGVQFELTPNAQIWPRTLNTMIGGTAGGIYLIVSDSGSNSGSGLDFFLGLTFLERFYSVYDTGNQRVGLATTSFTTATSN